MKHRMLRVNEVVKRDHRARNELRRRPGQHQSCGRNTRLKKRARVCERSWNTGPRERDEQANVSSSRVTGRTCSSCYHEVYAAPYFSSRYLHRARDQGHRNHAGDRSGSRRQEVKIVAAALGPCIIASRRPFFEITYPPTPRGCSGTKTAATT